MLPFGKIDPKKMQAMLKQMGINSRELDAQEVTIKCSDKNILIKNPQVSEIEMHGTKSFQISGDVHVSATAAALAEENGKISEIGDISEHDIKFVMEKSRAGREEVIDALQETHGDIAKAIMMLKRGKNR